MDLSFADPAICTTDTDIFGTAAKSALCVAFKMSQHQH